MTRQIWIGCLAAYNQGDLYGEWVDSEGVDLDSLQEEMERILKGSPVPHAEEYFIADHEGYCEMVSTEPSLHEIAGAEAAIDRLHDDSDEIIEAFGAFVAHRGFAGSLEDEVPAFEEAFCGFYNSEVEYAEQLLDDIGGLKDDNMLARYFDYDAFARDLFMGDNWAERMGNGDLAVFHNI